MKRNDAESACSVISPMVEALGKIQSQVALGPTAILVPLLGIINPISGSLKGGLKNGVHFSTFPPFSLSRFPLKPPRP